MNKQVDYPHAWAEGWQRLWDMNSGSFETTQRICRDFMDGSGRVQDEVVDYWRDACQSYLKAAERLGRCTSPEEAVAVQADLANETVARFLDESRKITELVGEAISAVATPSGRPPATHHRQP